MPPRFKAVATAAIAAARVSVSGHAARPLPSHVWIHRLCLPRVAQINHDVVEHKRATDRRLRLEHAHATATRSQVPRRWEKTLVSVEADPLCDVEGGAASQLYHYLWLKNTTGSSSGRGHSPSEFKLPDTVRPPNGVALFFADTDGRR